MAEVSRAYTGQFGKPIPAKVLRGGLAISVFRCDHCGRWMNEKWRVEYDGRWVCKLYCMDSMTPTELDQLWAEQQAQADSWESNERPVEATGTGILGINSRTPDVLSLGASDSDTIAITGFGLSSADTVAFERPELSAAVVYASTTAATITVTSTACPAGDYWWSYDGTKYHKRIQVR